MFITLTWSEVMQAATVGIMRQTSNLRDRRRDAYGLAADADGWGLHIEGCGGELAAAKALNVFWSGSHGLLRAPDIGSKFQVRQRSRSTGDLILHPDDPDDAVFILVLGRAPTYEIVGWLRGHEGKRTEFWKDPAGGRPAFFVPRTALHPFTDTDWLTDPVDQSCASS